MGQEMTYNSDEERTLVVQRNIMDLYENPKTKRELIKHARRFGKSIEDAEDIIQLSVVKAYSKAHMFRFYDGSNVRNWLYIFIMMVPARSCCVKLTVMDNQRRWRN